MCFLLDDDSSSDFRLLEILNHIHIELEEPVLYLLCLPISLSPSLSLPLSLLPSYPLLPSLSLFLSHLSWI